VADNLDITVAAELFVVRPDLGRVGFVGGGADDVVEQGDPGRFTFHTKAELLHACYELAVLGEDDPRAPPAQPWYSAPDPRTITAINAKYGVSPADGPLLI
jgi:hypothetical protein